MIGVGDIRSGRPTQTCRGKGQGPRGALIGDLSADFAIYAWALSRLGTSSRNGVTATRRGRFVDVSGRVTRVNLGKPRDQVGNGTPCNDWRSPESPWSG